MKWEYDGDFLEQFEPKFRGTIGDQICRIIREGDNLASSVLNKMRVHCLGRMTTADYNHEFYSQFYAALLKPNAVPFVQFLIDRESLSYEEKHKLKQSHLQETQSKWMAEQPPSEKQLSYLKSLGCQIEPKNKLEASNLITQFKSK